VSRGRTNKGEYQLEKQKTSALLKKVVDHTPQRKARPIGFPREGGEPEKKKQGSYSQNAQDQILEPRIEGAGAAIQKPFLYPLEGDEEGRLKRKRTSGEFLTATNLGRKPAWHKPAFCRIEREKRSIHFREKKVEKSALRLT